MRMANVSALDTGPLHCGSDPVLLCLPLPDARSSLWGRGFGRSTDGMCVCVWGGVEIRGGATFKSC